jgi:transposase
MLEEVQVTPGEVYPSAEGRLFLVGLICDLDVGGGRWCPLNIGGHLSMSGEPRRSRRRWGEAFKRRVVAEAAEPGVSVASVARRHDLNANLLFNWRRRYGAEGSFLPVALVPCGPSPAEIAKEAAGPYRAGRIEIALAAGHRVTLEGGFDPDAVARLLRGLVS